jgi:adenylate cyclase
MQQDDAHKGTDGQEQSLGPRRLAVIAFADVVGYSTLMAVDERGTLARWMTLMSSLIEPELARWNGRIVDMAGDGVLVEFPSVGDAVAWAQTIQQAVHRTRTEAEAILVAAPMALRISVHVGDVFARGDRLFGDAVNFAARLQDHAGPGGIVISTAVRDLLPPDLATAFRDVGHVALKGFERPARLFALDTHKVQAAPAVASAGGLPSVAVLPLRGPGDDDGYFAEGIVEDVVTSLAGLRELFVISSASTVAFRGRTVDPREAGLALGVRYVLQGSLRRRSPDLLVSLQLCDSQTGAVLWGERIQVAPDGLFEAQERIVRRVVTGLAPQVRAAELRRAMRKRPESLTAYDRLLRALHVMGSADRSTFETARTFLSEAIQEEPGFASAVALAARWHSVRLGRGWSPAPAEDEEQALALATRAVALDRRNPMALATLGHLKSILLHDCDAAMECFTEALDASPNDSLSWTLSSATLSYLGRGAEAVRHAEHGLRLSPQDPMRFSQYMFLAIAHYANQSFDDAVRWINLSAAENPLHRATLLVQAASLTAAGLKEEGRKVVHSFRRLHPGFSLETYGRTRQPFRTLPLRAMWLGHLNEAGLAD